MSTRADIIRQYALHQVGGPYVYGATGQPCTPNYRRERQKQYPQYAETIAKHCPVLSGKQSGCQGCRHNGRLAFDCAQLTRRAAEAAGLKLPSGAGAQWRSNYYAVKAPIDQLPPGQVAQLFRIRPDGVIAHTGIALGDGTAVDARSHADGVMHQPLGKYPWTHYAILTGQEAATTITLPPKPAQPPVQPKPPAQPNPPAQPEGPRTLQVIKGQPLMRGDDVRNIQKLLIQLGYSVGQKGADGVYGWDSHAAVVAFQRANGMPADGIVTLATKQAMAKAQGSVIYPSQLRYLVTLPDLTKPQADALLASFPNAQVTPMPVA